MCFIKLKYFILYSEKNQFMNKDSIWKLNQTILSFILEEEHKYWVIREAGNSISMNY